MQNCACKCLCALLRGENHQILKRARDPKKIKSNTKKLNLAPFNLKFIKLSPSSIWSSKFKNINLYTKFSKFTKINILVSLSKLIACHFGWASGLCYYHISSWCSLFLTYLTYIFTIKSKDFKTALNLPKGPSIYYIKLQCYSS